MCCPYFAPPPCCSHTYKRAVLFVDNAGADVMLGMPAAAAVVPAAALAHPASVNANFPCPPAHCPCHTRYRAHPFAGMLPFARELLRRGTQVIIAANSAPAINDITAAELDALLPQASAAGNFCC